MLNKVGLQGITKHGIKERILNNEEAKKKWLV
jgi:hypothetical protein